MSDAIAIIRARHAAPATEHGRYFGFARDTIGTLLEENDRLAAAHAELQELQKRHFEERNHYRDRAFEADGKWLHEQGEHARSLLADQAALQLACDTSADHIRERDEARAELERLRTAAVTSEQAIARQLWTAEAAVHRVEEHIGDVLDNLFGHAGWHDFITDASDESVEVFGVAAVVTLDDGAKAALRAMGFRRVWLHAHESKTRQAGERAYVLGDDALNAQAGVKNFGGP